MASVSGCASSISFSAASRSGIVLARLDLDAGLGELVLRRGERLARAFAGGLQPPVSSTPSRAGLARLPKSTSPVTPTKPGSPPARSAIAVVTAQVSARVAPSTPGAALAEMIMRAAAVDPADARLVADHAAEARRPQDRADHLRAEPGRHHAGADRGGRAARRAAGRARGVVRVLVVCHGWLAANSVVVVLPTMTAPASRNACTVAESRRDSGAFEDRRALAGGHVGGFDDVLDRDRHAVDRRQRLAGAPARRGGVGGACCAPSLFSTTKAPMRRVELGDAVEASRRDRRAAWSCRRADRPPAPRSRAACSLCSGIHGRTAGVSIFIPRARHIR